MHQLETNISVRMLQVQHRYSTQLMNATNFQSPNQTWINSWYRERERKRDSKFLTMVVGKVEYNFSYLNIGKSNAGNNNNKNIMK